MSKEKLIEQLRSAKLGIAHVAANEIEYLRAKVKELEAENARLLAANRDCIDHFDAAYKDLTAEQYKVKALTDALEFYANTTYDMFPSVARKALATVKDMK